MESREIRAARNRINNYSRYIFHIQHILFLFFPLKKVSFARTFILFKYRRDIMKCIFDVTVRRVLAARSSTWAKLRSAKSWRQQQPAGVVVGGLIFLDVTGTSTLIRVPSQCSRLPPSLPLFFLPHFSLHRFSFSLFWPRDVAEPGE